jgi:frataxin
MDEKAFHCLADGTLSSIEEDLEEADQAGYLEVEAVEGVVTLLLPGGKQCIISKHTPMRQIWLSSPFSGAHHFRYDEAANQWVLENGQELRALLTSELAGIIGPDRS